MVLFKISQKAFLFHRHDSKLFLVVKICYMLSPQYWGQNIMTEVLQAVLKYAFEEIVRQKCYKNGRFIDTAQYAVRPPSHHILINDHTVGFGFNHSAFSLERIFLF